MLIHVWASCEKLTKITIEVVNQEPKEKNNKGGEKWKGRIL
jgi:hypothetical protein